MKKDEYDIFLKGQLDSIDIPPKRFKYILKKWAKQGLISNSKLTDEFHRIRKLILHKNEDKYNYLDDLDGRVAIVEFIQEHFYPYPRNVGIIQNHDDNGWWFITKSLKQYQLDFDYSSIAYVELHPNPKKIWRLMNYLAWKRENREDCFHQKITEMSWTTTSYYSKANEVIYTNPLGNLGECFPWCQCKFL